ncbi:MAG TPA: VanW family protein [Roseiflexaceae bacterium]|nr:VanW family protein [Roseiflexaceae bacterium]
MFRRLAAAIASMLFLTLSFGGSHAQTARAAQTPPLPIQYVDATGHTLRDPFLSFYNAHGGATIFGPPLTEVVAQDGIALQYFTYARFEWHNDHVVLSSLGRSAAAGKESTAPFAWLNESPGADRTLIKESGHSIGGAFAWFWKTNGGVAVFGYPISEEFTEQGALVQYFERARFAYDAANNTVTRAPLGQQMLAQQPQAATWAARATPMTALGSATMIIPSVAQHNVALATKALNGTIVQPGQELSFLKAVGAISPKQGYVSGLAIVGDQLVETVGGGVCYVSTTLYRAVWAAGLEVTQKTGHSIMLAAFADQPGMDAAIETSGLDFRWRNDTSDLVYVEAGMQGSQLTFTLWGINDGRKVSSSKPVITNRQAAGAPTWTYDGTLPSGTTRVLSDAIAGMNVRVDRAVTRADGSVLRRDRMLTAYQPSPAMVYFGPGVTPPGDAIVLGVDVPPVSASRR